MKRSSPAKPPLKLILVRLSIRFTMASRRNGALPILTLPLLPLAANHCDFMRDATFTADPPAVLISTRGSPFTTVSLAQESSHFKAKSEVVIPVEVRLAIWVMR